MTDKECKQFMKDFEKRDIYTTHSQSVEGWDGFLNQCKRAINKLYSFQGSRVSVKTDFWSSYADDQAYNFLIKRGGYDNLLWDERQKRWAEYEKAKKLSYWEFLKKYQFLTVQDGIHCVDFDWSGIVFAAYSTQCLVDMGVYTAEESKLYIDCLFQIKE